MTYCGCHNSECMCHRRILVVDNDPDDRADYIESLRYWGFHEDDIFAAQGRGQKLLDDAKHKAKAHRCHLALVDLRLLDNNSPDDDSGLQLLPELAPTRTILVTGYGTMQITRQAIQEQGAFSAVGKQESLGELRRAVFDALGELCGGATRLIWPPDWDEQRVAQELSTGNAQIDADEVRDVIIQLFPDAHSIKIEHLDGATSTPLKSPSRRRSIVFAAYEDQRVPVIIKLAFAARVQQEVKNYNCFVDGRIRGFKNSQLLKSVTLWKLGGMSYALIGGNLHGNSICTLSEKYKQVADAETILRPLQEYFDEIWAENYGRREVRAASLLEVYYAVWQEELTELDPLLQLETLLQEWENQSASRTFHIHGTMQVPNPYRWIAEHHNATHFPNLQWATIHGDLHGNNIMVDDDDHPWIIDFGRTQRGYLLFDVTELMQYLLTRVADFPPQQLACFYELAVALADFAQPHLALSKTICESAEARKMHGLLAALRDIAQRMSMYRDPREFLWGVLLESTFVSLIIGHDKPRCQKMLLLAGIICQRLDTWGHTDWIPGAWPAIEWDAE